MPPPLFSKPFNLEMVADLGDFSCGDGIFAKFADEWIRCTNPKNSAARSMTFGTLVWLYYLESGQLIGFGSVGPTKRQPDGSLPPVGLIPQLGVHRDFHRYPPGADRNDRISSAIVRDLISKARELQFGTLVLYVHKDNISAKNLYDRNQFVAVPPPDESGYETMMVRI